MAEGDGGGGITSTGGPTAPILTLTPIADGDFLGNLTGATAVPGPTNFVFLNLRDTPVTYAGQALRLTRVNAGETALEFHQEVFTDLHDVPSTYAGQALKIVRVNAAATALEFATAATAGGAYVPLSSGSEPLFFISDGAGRAIEVAYS